MKNKSIRKIAALAVTMILSTVLAGCGASGGRASEQELFQTMETVDIEGNQVDSSVFAENTLTLVNLWNVGCTPCINELPELAKLKREYEGKGVAVKGLYYTKTGTLSEEEREDIKDILEKAGAGYQQLIISEDMLSGGDVGSILPNTYVVDAEGNIVNEVAGSRDYEGWKEFIEDELQKVEENAEK